METEAAKRIHDGLSAQQAEALLTAMAKGQLDKGNPDLYAMLTLRLMLIEQKLDFVLSAMKAVDEPNANDNATREASRRKGLLIIGGLLLAAVLLL